MSPASKSPVNRCTRICEAAAIGHRQLVTDGGKFTVGAVRHFSVPSMEKDPFFRNFRATSMSNHVYSCVLACASRDLYARSISLHQSTLLVQREHNAMLPYGDVVSYPVFPCAPTDSTPVWSLMKDLISFLESARTVTNYPLFDPAVTKTIALKVDRTVFSILLKQNHQNCLNTFFKSNIDKYRHTPPYLTVKHGFLYSAS